MRHNTKISGQQTSLFGKDESTCSPEAFPVSPSAWQENEKEPQTTATSGRRCCEQFGRLHPAGSWARMFSESLIGRRDWSSNRCVLIWKLKGTRCNRTYFQLAASTRRTRDTAPGSSPMLLKTPSAIDAYAHRLNKKELRFGNSGSLAQKIATGFIYRRGLLPTVQTQGLKICENGKSAPVPLTLLPTPTVSDATNSSIPPSQIRRDNLAGAYLRGMLPTPTVKDATVGSVIGRRDRYITTSEGSLRKISSKGTERSVGLGRLSSLQLLPTPRASKITGSDRADFSPSLPGLLRRNMLPTPKANDFRSGMPNRVGTVHTQQLNDTMAYQAGTTSRLNPLFVEEMMGFPTYWILTPFLRDCRRNNANAETARSAGEPNR